MRHLVFALFLFFPAALSAQPRVSPEVFGRAGILQLWDDEGNIGAGPSIGGGAGIRLPGGIGLEAIVERHTNKRHFTSGVSFDSNAVSGVGRAMKYFGTSTARPYVGGSFGITRIKTHSEFPGFASNDRETTSATVGGFAGVRFQVGSAAFVRPEIELSRAGEHLRIAGSLAVGFGR
jgi:outer membrane protein with beta-barrel domain